MSIPSQIAKRLTLPIVCAPMFLISTPAMVVEACGAGLVGAIPRANARSREEFRDWLRGIRDELSERTSTPGPVAVNVRSRLEHDEIIADLDLCVEFGVEIIITAVGDPTHVVQLAHERGLLVHHDATSLRFARKAIDAGVDGLTLVGTGGGGHSGTVSHLALIPRVRSMFDGTISLAGAVSTGAAVRAAEVLGADLAYMGTRFAATVESAAHPQQKAWMVDADSTSLRYTNRVNGAHANWLVPSLEQHGIDIDALPIPEHRSTDHLPVGVRPWRDLWSVGQGIELINDIPPTAELIERLAREYEEACRIPDRLDAVRSLL